ncbi:uncharacterized protein ARMOST_21086 [Armillaria ostoyae]|uniref:Uncharacterized protein n=1 Tax=Armillaria ostoyae TaxID=47428 RepID=A0A284S949_ARMOS|nr:uncharacterized protein ARMOST_21086 [Armillaria ostoyae]
MHGRHPNSLALIRLAVELKERGTDQLGQDGLGLFTLCRGSTKDLSSPKPFVPKPALGSECLLSGDERRDLAQCDTRRRRQRLSLSRAMPAEFYRRDRLFFHSTVAYTGTTFIDSRYPGNHFLPEHSPAARS